MSLGSVHTNEGALIALNALDSTASALQSTEKQVATGYRVADAVDDGAAYSIAQSLRSSAAALASVNVALGNAQGLLSTTLTGLTSASNELISMKATLVNLAAGESGTAAQKNYVSTYASELSDLKSYFTGATYNGRTLLSNFNNYSSGFGSFSVVQDEFGRTYHVSYYSTSQVYANLSQASISSGTVFATFIASGGTFDLMMATVGKWLVSVGDQVNAINNRISFNSGKIDALDSGLGALVDADLAAESAMLTALELRQQLEEQALSIANSTPSMLLALFK
jgi:flagellin